MNVHHNTQTKTIWGHCLRTQNNYENSSNRVQHDREGSVNGYSRGNKNLSCAGAGCSIGFKSAANGSEDQIIGKNLLGDFVI